MSGVSLADLLPSAALTVSGSTVIDLPNDIRGDVFSFWVNVTAASGTTPTLDLYIQSTFDGGTTWMDVIAFPQLTAAGSRVITVPRLTATGAMASASVTPTDGAQAANSVSIIPISDQIRIKYTIAGTTPSFTTNVKLFAR